MSDDLWEGFDVEAKSFTGWQPVDLAPVLSKNREPIVPAIGDRADGVHMFYPGKTHSIVSESEAGKSWLALLTVATEAMAGHSTIFLDFEDDENIHVDHLRTIGLPDDKILSHFHYYRPESAISQMDRLHLVGEAARLSARSIWLDGITEAMALHGLDPISNSDVAEFNARMINPFARQGIAVIGLDHVVKNSENRGRYGLGGVHKMNAISGAQFSLENVEPFGIGRTGKSRIRIAKDRPGRLRQHGLPAKEGLVWFGDLVIKSYDEMSAEFSIEPPHEGTTGSFRPTGLMAQFSRYIEEHDGLSYRALIGAIQGKDTTKALALELLATEGYIRVEKVGQSKIHKHVRPFGSGPEDD